MASPALFLRPGGHGRPPPPPATIPTGLTPEILGFRDLPLPAAPRATLDSPALSLRPGGASRLPPPPAATRVIYTRPYVLGWSFVLNGAAPPLDTSKLPALPRFGPKPRAKVLEIVLPIATGGFVLALAIAFFLFMRTRVRYAEVREDWEVEYGPHRFSYKQLYKATWGFKNRQLLGTGGFGRVYKGVLPKNNLDIAVKRVSHDSKQGMKEFIAEVVSLGHLRQRNLVQLLGYCRRQGELLLVYDCMPNGSIDKCLHDKTKPVLDWGQRFQIIRAATTSTLQPRAPASASSGDGVSLRPLGRSPPPRAILPDARSSPSPTLPVAPTADIFSRPTCRPVSIVVVRAARAAAHGAPRDAGHGARGLPRRPRHLCYRRRRPRLDAVRASLAAVRLHMRPFLDSAYAPVQPLLTRPPRAPPELVGRSRACRAARHAEDAAAAPRGVVHLLVAFHGRQHAGRRPGRRGPRAAPPWSCSLSPWPAARGASPGAPRRWYTTDLLSCTTGPV